MTTIVELPSDDLVEAGRTSEILGARVLLANGALGDWLIRSDAAWRPAPIEHVDLPPARRSARHPYLAVVLLFLVMAICVPIVAISCVLVLEDHFHPIPTVVAIPKPRATSPMTNSPVTNATTVTPPTPVEPKAIDVNDLPRATGKKIGRR